MKPLRRRRIGYVDLDPMAVGRSPINDARRGIDERRCADRNEQVRLLGRGTNVFQPQWHFTKPNDVRSQGTDFLRIIRMGRRHAEIAAPVEQFACLGTASL